MAKRASGSSLKGSRGQTAVKLKFEDLDWGPVPVLEHDDGTDFFVQVRDVHRFELGLLLVQVKNEKKYFSKGALAKGLVDGGWASQDDTKYWLEHTVPHIVALYDRSTAVAYWGHVTVGRAMSGTGCAQIRGAVMAAQVVARDQSRHVQRTCDAT